MFHSLEYNGYIQCASSDFKPDGHNDLAILIRFLYGNEIYDEKFTKPFEEGGMKGQVDLPRLKAGKNGGAFWSAFVMCPANLTDFSDDNYIEGLNSRYFMVYIGVHPTDSSQPWP